MISPSDLAAIYRACPFCGHTPEMRDELQSYCVFCKECGACGPYAFKEQEAIEFWNERTPIKWPTYQQIIEASEDYSFDSVDGENAIEWLKSFVEKGQRE